MIRHGRFQSSRPGGVVFPVYQACEHTRSSSHTRRHVVKNWEETVASSLSALSRRGSVGDKKPNHHSLYALLHGPRSSLQPPKDRWRRAGDKKKINFLHLFLLFLRFTHQRGSGFLFSFALLLNFLCATTFGVFVFCPEKKRRFFTSLCSSPSSSCSSSMAIINSKTKQRIRDSADHKSARFVGLRSFE